MTTPIALSIAAAGLAAFTGFCIALNTGEVARELEGTGAGRAEGDRQRTEEIWSSTSR